MSLDAQDLRQMAEERKNGDYLTEEWSGRQARFSDRNSRINTMRAMARGDWTTVFPGESAKLDFPKVQNIVNDALQDIGDLAGETVSSVRCDPDSEAKSAEQAALLRAGILGTHWRANDGERLVSQLAMDYVGTGGMFVCVYPTERSDYPRYLRYDPMNCYPDIAGGELQDLMVVTKMKTRKLARMYPELGLDTRPNLADDSEVIDYYGSDEILKLILFGPRTAKKRSNETVYRVENKINRPPVAWAKRPAFDDEFRGLFDQLPGILNAENRIVEMILASTDQAINAPLLEHDVENAEEFGPGALLHGRSAEAKMERIQPAGVSNHLFALMGLLEAGAHASGAYPASRQGEVSQSIASAAFVAATQGRLTSVTRATSRAIASVREQLNQIGLAIEENWLDFQKPLLVPVGNKKSYSPSKDIGKRYQNRVINPALTGIGLENQHVILAQDYGSGWISAETALANSQYVEDPAEEMHKRLMEDLQKIYVQQKLVQPGFPLGDVITAMQKGQDFLDAAAAAEQKFLAAQQAQAAPAAGGAPQGAAPDQASQEALALEKGGVPGGEDNSVPAYGQLPDLSNVVKGQFQKPFAQVATRNV